MRYEAGSYMQAVDITEARYGEIKKARATCLFALEVEEKLALLLSNYYELETTLLKQAESARLWPHRDHNQSMEDRLTIDQRIVNLLSSCRLYLDQIDHSFSQVYGKKCDEGKEIKAYKSELYDSHFGYRFMEALRNHVQHSALPVHLISGQAALILGKKEDYQQITVIPQSVVSKLEEDRDFKKSVLSELKDRDDPIDLRSEIREYISCFIKLHKHIQEKIDDKVTKDRRCYEDALDEYMESDDSNNIGPSLFCYDQGNKLVETIALVHEFLIRLDYLKKKQDSVMDLTRSFASNSDQEPAR